jgi:predicted short-subunit dehydrogenase-like oxidoreductase (DUF2520 family)
VKTLTIVGVGNAGGALAIALSRAGYRIEKLVHRNGRVARRIKRELIPSADVVKWPGIVTISSDIILIAVSDPEISTVARGIEEKVKKGQVVLHTSGSLTSRELSNLDRVGCYTGSIHPLVSISDPFRVAEQFGGVYFCVEGDKRAVSAARGIVKSLQGKSFTLDPSKKALYHAAAVTSAGHATALFDVAVEMLSKCGVTQKEAAHILLPLLHSAARNLERQSPEEALTGSFARLDIAAFERHLASFKPLSKPVIQLYYELAERSLDIVERRDGPSERLAEFRDRISIAKRNSK